MPSEPTREKLPFEPRQKKKKPSKISPPSQPQGSQKEKDPKVTASAIPEVVSKRMIWRMALFCGIPTALGMLSFVMFYWIVSHDWLEVPPYMVVTVSFGLFFLGILGLSYGIFSASWDEEVGTLLGWQEFKTNFGRTVDAWRSAKKEAKKN